MIYDAYGKPVTQEIAIGYGRASIMEALGLDFKNPDAIAREKGLAYYDDAAKDPHCKSVLGTRIMALIGCSRELQAASDDPLDQAAHGFLKAMFDSMERGLDAVIEQSFRAVTKNGYTVQEVIWRNTPTGTVIRDISASACSIC